MTSSTASRFFSANSGCFSSKATRRSLPRSIGSYISFSPIASETEWIAHSSSVIALKRLLSLSISASVSIASNPSSASSAAITHMPTGVESFLMSAYIIGWMTSTTRTQAMPQIIENSRQT